MAVVTVSAPKHDLIAFLNRHNGRVPTIVATRQQVYSPLGLTSLNATDDLV